MGESPILCPPVKPGECIGVMAPSSYIERSDIDASKAAVEAKGYRVYVHPQTYMRHKQFAGTPTDKLKAFHDLLAREDIKAIWAAGGGNGAMQFIDAINYDLVRENPKPLIGYSDVTALLCALHAHTGLIGLHAPVFRQIHKHQDLDAALGLLMHDPAALRMDLGQCEVIRSGRAKGTLIGGNLSVFQYLPATLPGELVKGSILFLEDCNEELSHFDRMLTHLKRSGVFHKINGVIFGEFTNMKDTGKPFEMDVGDIITHHTQDMDIPILMNAPFGHGANLKPILLGAAGELDTSTLSLQINTPQ